MSESKQPLFSNVHVQLSGGDGNVFAIIGTVSAALKQAGYSDGAKEFSAAAMKCKSYDEVLILCMNTVEVS